MTAQRKSVLTRSGKAFTVLLTTAIKLVGLVSAVNELFVQQAPQPVALAVSAFMMAGAQLSEEVILNLLEKLIQWGVEEPRHAHHAAPDDRSDPP